MRSNHFFQIWKKKSREVGKQAQKGQENCPVCGCILVSISTGPLQCNLLSGVLFLGGEQKCGSARVGGLHSPDRQL